MSTTHTALAIPSKHYQRFALLIKLEKDSLRRLIECGYSVNPNLNITKMSVSIAEATNIDLNIVREIVRLLMTLNSLKREKYQDSSEFVEELINAVNSINDTTFTADMKSKFTDLRSELIELFSSDNSFALTSKARSVFTDHKNVFCSSDIISDIRPIFNDEASQVKILSVYHNLIIRYHEDENYSIHKEIHVALDSEDLKHLMEQIIRAQKKENTISKSFTDIGFSIFENSSVKG